MFWREDQSLWQALRVYFLFLVSIKLGSGSLWAAYQESWNEFFRLVLGTLAVSVFMALSQISWFVWQRRRKERINMDR